jgi:recombinational DNA repair protein RecR
MSEIDRAVDEVVDAARELAQAISQLRRCQCGRLTRQKVCPVCGTPSEDT